MTSNPLSASPPHPTPLHPSPLLASSPSSSRTFRHTGSTARLENDTILQEDRTLVKTASFVEQGYITSRVSRYRCPRFTACTSISISREIKIEKKENEKARISFLPLSLSLRSKGGFALSANRQSTRNDGYTHRPVVTQRNA